MIQDDNIDDNIDQNQTKKNSNRLKKFFKKKNN